MKGLPIFFAAQINSEHTTVPLVSSQLADGEDLGNTEELFGTRLPVDVPNPHENMRLVDMHRFTIFLVS